MRALGYSFRLGWTGVLRSGGSGAFAVLAITLAMIVLGALLLLTWNGERMLARWSSAAEFSVYLRDDYRCRCCDWTPPVQDDEKATFRGLNFLTLDHIRPRSKGGTNVQENLQTLCFLCNMAKGNGPRPRPAKREYLAAKRLERTKRRRQLVVGTADAHHLLPRYQTA